MFPLIRSLTLRYLVQKWDRSLLVALSIALGVATLVSARLLNQYFEAAAFDSTMPAAVADLYVANGEIGVDWGVSEDLKKATLPGVRTVRPFVLDRIALPELGERAATLFGADLSQPSPDEAKRANQLKFEFQLINPLARRPIALSRKLYEARKARGRSDADPVEVRFTNRKELFDLLGVVDLPKDSPMAPFADSIVAMNVEQAAKLIRRPGGADSPGRVNRVDIHLDGSVPVDVVKEQVERIVSARASVRTPEENRKSTEQVIGGVKLIFNLCSFGSLVIGLFLVYNALSVTVAERRHDIGVMRSLGATRVQIARLFAIEAMILGAIGAVPGIPLGIGLADFALSQFGEELTVVFLNSDMARPGLDWATALIAIAAGMLTALLAALVPAIQAASDEPADAVRRAPKVGFGVFRRIHAGSCIALIAASPILFLLRDELPSRKGSSLAVVSLLVGLLLSMPYVMSWLAHLMPLVRGLLGVEARLAADNLSRSPGRTGVVVGALAAGVTLVFLTAGVGKSNEVPINAWLDQVIRADAFVFRGNLASANSSMSPMEPSIRTELQNLPGVERVVGLRFYRPEFNGTFILVLGLDAHDYHRGVRSRMPEGLPKLDLFDRLPGGNFTVVSDNFAAKWNKKVGDEVVIAGPRGPITLEIIGVGQDYSWSQGTIFLDRAKYSELFDDPVVDAFHVFFKEESDPTTFGRVQSFAEENGLLVQTRDSVRLYIGGVLDRMFRVAYVQQFIVAIVAALGVVTSLLISVLQRRRELGLLRAVGATQLQILKTVFAESLLMGLFGVVLGFAIGVPLEWFVLDVIFREESGFVFEMLIPWREATGIALGSVVIATLAGLVPAFRAARMRITDAIAYE